MPRRTARSAALIEVRRAGLLAALIVAAGVTGAAAQEIEHYVLALSWSPSYCETADPGRDRLQCAPAADRAFVVHGLWPNAPGAEPSYCDASGTPSRGDVEAMLDIMPSRSLVAYQWRKHGTCSGLSPQEYFTTVRRAFARVTIPGGLVAPASDIEVRPEVLREAFRRANPDLGEDAIYVRCRGGQLDEVRICMTTGLDFTACPDVGRQRCRSRLIDVPAPE